jgi:hypothetical protein
MAFAIYLSTYFYSFQPLLEILKTSAIKYLSTTIVFFPILAYIIFPLIWFCLLPYLLDSTIDFIDWSYSQIPILKYTNFHKKQIKV